MSVSLLFVDINLLFISSCYTRTSFTDPSAKYKLTDGGSFYGISFDGPPLYLLSHWEKFLKAPPQKKPDRKKIVPPTP